jgi:hypothetical protein
MSSIFRKALGMFVEFEDDAKNVSPQTALTSTNMPADSIKGSLSKAEAEKFEKHFDKLFDQANLPGPDYYEFYKMMETLEAHIVDEKTRLKATFDSLHIQGLTKPNLVDTAKNYKSILEKDKAEFEKALTDKINQDVGSKKKEITDLEGLIIKNNELIQKLTIDNAEYRKKIEALTKNARDEEEKLNRNSNSYRLASQAIINKIADDIEKISTLL